MRSRKWFLVVNQGANCYSSIPSIVGSLKNCMYAYILHDKDNEEQPHYTICLDYKNARSFETLFYQFTGANIKSCSYWNRSIQYLIHINDKDKYQYDINEIVTNYSNDELMSLLASDEYEQLTTESLVVAISTGEVKSFTQCVLKYGISQCSTKTILIKELLREHNMRNIIERS